MRSLPIGFRRVAFVRHPYDRLASFYRGSFPRVWDAPFSEYIDWVIDTDATNTHVTPLSRLVPDNIDFMGRFERLAEDWEIAKTYFSHVRPLLHLNKGGSGSWEELFDTLDAGRLDALDSLYGRDMERFGYG